MKARCRWQTTCSFFIISSAWLHRHFQGERAEEKKRFAGAAVKIKFNKTKHAHVLLVLFVCKKIKNKKMKKRFPWSGMRSGDGNIYLTYSPSEHKQASAILPKVIFLPFGLRCTDSSHYSKSQGRDASARDGAPSAHLNEAVEQQLRNKKSSDLTLETNCEEQLTSLRAADSE